MDDAVLKDVSELGGDIIASKRFEKAKSVPHHSKSGNIALHSLETAGYALMLSRWLKQHGVEVNEVDAVRASLLHDIGMTEDKVFLSPSPIKAWTHPREGMRIAQEEYGVNKVQAEAIKYHMFPVYSLPPRSMVGWVVTAADKCCSIHEVGRTSEEIVDRAGRSLLQIWKKINS